MEYQYSDKIWYSGDIPYSYTVWIPYFRPSSVIQVRDEKTSAFAGKPTTGESSGGFFGVLGGILGRLTGQAEADALADEDITMADL